MKNYFWADEGTYTSFTDVEIKKGIFNVKAAIRDLLIERLGYANIPRAGRKKKANRKSFIRK